MPMTGAQTERDFNDPEGSEVKRRRFVPLGDAAAVRQRLEDLDLSPDSKAQLLEDYDHHLSRGWTPRRSAYEALTIQMGWKPKSIL